MAEPRVMTLGTERRRGQIRVCSGEPGSRRGGDLVSPFDARVVWRDADEVHVVLVPTMALLLDGDHIELRVSVGAGTRLRVVEISGTVAYSGPGNGASYLTTAEVGPGGALAWLGQPFVLAAGSQVRRSTTVSLEEGATACIREILVLGRTGEESGTGRIATRIDDETGPLLVEELAIGTAHRLPGILGRAKVLDQITLVGTDPRESHPDTLRLAGRGAVNRRLAASAHLTAEDDLAESWAAHAFAAARRFRAEPDAGSAWRPDPVLVSTAIR
ncbi:MAG TPA: urease accessory protein UreD [Arachnia sp.]|nr:urease accessory protein UreD [Arachnia sp.]HMT87079.1 urease accessory protein UreD [Arachnia sp.]